MATPKQDDLSRTGTMILQALQMVVEYEQKKREDPIGLRRIAFMGSLMDKAPNDLFLWTQSTVTSPQGVAHTAKALRQMPDFAGALATIRSEFEVNQTKIGGRLKQIVTLIQVDPDLKSELFAVIPFSFPKTKLELEEDEDEVEIVDSPEAKVNKLLSDARAVPRRVERTSETQPNVIQAHWKIIHNDGIIIYVPSDHPGVSHLEELQEAGTQLNLSNIFKLKSLKRKASDASVDDPQPALTRTARLQMEMERARDDKVRAIKLKIPLRQAALKRANPALSDDVVTYRSYGWAKYEIELRNRFVPPENRDQVTQSAWDLLFGTRHLNLNSTQLTNVDTFYGRYKSRQPTYSHVEERDGRSD